MIDGPAGLTLADYLAERERLPQGEGLATMDARTSRAPRSSGRSR